MRCLVISAESREALPFPLFLSQIIALVFYVGIVSISNKCRVTTSSENRLIQVEGTVHRREKIRRISSSFIQAFNVKISREEETIHEVVASRLVKIRSTQFEENKKKHRIEKKIL